MASYNVTAPDGTNYRVSVPKGVTPTPQQLFEYVQTNLVPKSPFSRDVQAAATKYGVDPKLVHSVIKQESAYNPRAVSSAGAQGLMQLMPSTATQLGVKDPFHPQQNIEGGVKHLKYLLDKYGGNKELAIAAYNAGEGNVEKYGGIPPFAETEAYVRKVLGAPGKPDVPAAPAPVPLTPSVPVQPEPPKEDLGQIAVQSAKHGLLSTVVTPAELLAKGLDLYQAVTEPISKGTAKLLGIEPKPAPKFGEKYINPVLERVTEKIAGPKPEPKTGKGQTVALAAGLGGATLPFAGAGAARYAGRKLIGSTLPDLGAGVRAGLKGVAAEAKASRGGIGYRPPEPFDYGVTAADEAKILARINHPESVVKTEVPTSAGVMPSQGTVMDPKGASSPGLPPYKTFWDRTIGKLFPHLPVLQKQPQSPVVTISQQRAVSLGEDMGRMFDQPWAQFLYKGGSREDFTRAFAQWEAEGFVNAPAEIKAAKAWLEALRPREQAAAKYLGERSLDDIANYWPHIAEDSTNLLKVGRHETGVISDLRSTLGMFERTRQYPTMLEGMQNGITYVDPRQAFLIRAWTSMKMIHTAEYLQALEKAGVLAAKPKGKSPIHMTGIPGGERYARSMEEGRFIQQQLQELGGKGPFSRMLHWGNAVLRNPNLINPVPHLVRNMAFKYWWSGGKMSKLVPDFREFLTNGNPEMIALFKQHMPFEYTGKTAADLMHDAMYRMNHPALKRVTNDWNLLWQMQRWSARTIFTRWDPAIKYARFKQYVQAGLTPQEAANNTNIDLIDYGMRSELVDWWKSLPLNFFVPWRVGTTQSLVKNMMQHPIRTALFIGAVDYIREVTYRNTGWWVHLPIDYVEAPIAQLIREGSKNPEKFARAVANVMGTTAAFGPGGRATAYQWQNVVDGLKGTIEWPKIKQMFWGLALLAEPYGSIEAFREGNYTKVLEIVASSIILGAHEALESRPKRGWEFAPESLPGLKKIGRVKTAEAIQDVREQKRDIRASMPERPKLKEILK